MAEPAAQARRGRIWRRLDSSDGVATETSTMRRSPMATRRINTRRPRRRAIGATTDTGTPAASSRRR